MAPVLNQPDYATAVQNQKKQNDKEKKDDLISYRRKPFCKDLFTVYAEKSRQSAGSSVYKYRL